jgi:hypothetical protein
MGGAGGAAPRPHPSDGRRSRPRARPRREQLGRTPRPRPGARWIGAAATRRNGRIAPPAAPNFGDGRGCEGACHDGYERANWAPRRPASCRSRFPSAHTPRAKGASSRASVDSSHGGTLRAAESERRSGRARRGPRMGSRGIVVVDRQRRDLHAFLRRELLGRALVLLDRRSRTTSVETPGERRRAPTVADAVLWQDHGCLVVGAIDSAAGDVLRLRAEVRRLARQLLPQATG